MKKLIYKCVIRKVNKIRDDIGLSPIEDLPQGIKRNAESCPIARAIGGRANHNDLRAPYGNYQYRYYRVGLCARWFMRKFDNGKYPELDELKSHNLGSG